MAERRLEVLLEQQRTGESVAEICRRHEISREIFYRYKRRYEAAGLAGLADKSRRPINSPNQTAADFEDLICRLRKDRPRWGARRIRAELRRAGWDPPAVSTIHQILRRNHLVADQPSRRPRRTFRRFERENPNDLWQIDASRLSARVWVIDIVDDHARFLLAALACSSPTGAAAWSCFETAARRHGLPRQVLSDNNTVFTGRLLGFTVDFERRLSALRVKLINGHPYHPQTQGKIERLHRTLKEFVADEGGVTTVAATQLLLDRFRDDYNHERPHQSLSDQTPSQRYRPSARDFFVPPVQQPSYSENATVRRASRNGVICFAYNHINLGRRWAEHVVQVAVIDGLIRVNFGDELLREVPFLPKGGRHPLGVRRRGAA